MDILKQLKEVTISVLPIAVFASVLSLLLGVMDGGEFRMFIVSCVFVIAGLTIFLTGADVGLLPMGTRIGTTLTKSRSLPILLAVAAILGFIITVPEPDVQVLASQVNQISNDIPIPVFICAIAVGVGIFLALSLARTILSLPLKVILLIGYIVIFSCAFFCDGFFVSVAFDSGGATTGPLSVPFIMAIGMGVASMRKHSEESEFGYVAMASIGPVLAVLILGIIFGSGGSMPDTAETSADIKLLTLFGEKLSGVGMSFFPLLIVCILMQIFFIKMPHTQAIRVFVGIFYSFVGLVIFFTGVEYSFSDVAKELGVALADHPVLLYSSGFIFGLCVVLAEPAVIVLTGQVEEISGGHIRKPIMLAALCLGVGLAVVLALIRTVYSLPILLFLVPGYILIMVSMIWTPGLFSAIAFDSGGVATGPMSSTFLLPLAIGAASGTASASLASSFGMIAMIAMMPILLIEILGIVYKARLRKAERGGR